MAEPIDQDEEVKILLPGTLPLAPVLPEGVTAVGYMPRAPIPVQHRDAEAIVLWGGSGRWQAEAAQDLPHLRWVQTLSAGSEVTEKAGFTADATITSGLGLHDVTVAEHALALILAAARRLDTAVRAVDEHRWAKELSINQPLDNATSFTIVRGSRIVIWGFGGVGQRLAGDLQALGVEVIGVARSAGERGGFPVITADDLPAALETADVLVNILPGSPETAGAVNADLLAHLPAKAWLINVGRGVTVDEQALAAALRAGTLAGAALDVTTVEPLPEQSELWNAPNLILTPHSAGGRPLGADELIEFNLAALLAGTPLRNVVRQAGETNQATS